jgi:outer membrane protein assembly factor BamE (lipoprotein component of BamABCDE complex)
MYLKNASLARHAVLVCVIALSLSSQSFAQRDVTTGPFSKVEEIETQLKQGVSKKADVQQLLGAPSGLGQAVFPPTYTPHEIWYYDDAEITQIKSGGADGMRGDMRFQQLIFFFDGETMTGYAWTSNSGEIMGKQKKDAK